VLTKAAQALQARLVAVLLQEREQAASAMEEAGSTMAKHPNNYLNPPGASLSAYPPYFSPLGETGGLSHGLPLSPPDGV
jgi:hypothetical protein